MGPETRTHYMLLQVTSPEFPVFRNFISIYFLWISQRLLWVFFPACFEWLFIPVCLGWFHFIADISSPLLIEIFITLEKCPADDKLYDYPNHVRHPTYFTIIIRVLVFLSILCSVGFLFFFFLSFWTLSTVSVRIIDTNIFLISIQYISDFHPIYFWLLYSPMATKMIFLSTSLV